MLRFEPNGDQIVKRLMDTISITKPLNIAKDAESCVLKFAKRLESLSFVLQTPEHRSMRALS